jgi:hypothetical protein
VLSLLIGLVITYRYTKLFRSQRERVPARVWVILFVRGLSIVAFGLLFLGKRVLWTFGFRSLGVSVTR